MERGKTQQFACFGGISPPTPNHPLTLLDHGKRV